MTAGGDGTNNEEIRGGGVANASLIGAAHGLLRPLILRRLKCDVLGGELPPKVGIFSTETSIETERKTLFAAGRSIVYYGADLASFRICIIA
jgi:hypothetical protein